MTDFSKRSSFPFPDLFANAMCYFAVLRRLLSTFPILRLTRQYFILTFLLTEFHGIQPTVDVQDKVHLEGLGLAMESAHCNQQRENTSLKLESTYYVLLGVKGWVGGREGGGGTGDDDMRRCYRDDSWRKRWEIRRREKIHFRSKAPRTVG